MYRAALTLCLGVGLSPLAVAADYEIDPSHAFIQFHISHLGFSTVAGRFNQFKGNFSWDKENPAASKIALTIDTASIDSNWAERDKHLRGRDFLDVEQFPEAKFESVSYEGDENGGLLLGNLTLHGVTKPIGIKVSAIGEGKDPWGGYRAGFSGTAELTRADFGMNFDLGPAAKKMTFDLFIEGKRK